MNERENGSSSAYKEGLEGIFEHLNHLILHENYEEAAAQMLKLHYADIADYLDNVSNKIYQLLLPNIAQDLKPEMIVCLSDSSKGAVLNAIGLEYSAALINQMDIEDAIEVMDALDENLKELLLEEIEPSQKQHIIEGFNYPEQAVGRIVERDFIALQEHWTCGQAIDYIRRAHFNKAFHAVIIVDGKYNPVGNVLLSSIVKNGRNAVLSEIMDSQFKVVDTYTDIDEMIFIFKQYALTLVPVVNKTGRLIGTVSINNMIYIIEERTESEFLHLGGVSTTDIFGNLPTMAIKRFPWLFVNLLTAFVTSMIIDQFTSTIAQVLSLATIMPIVASMGGNAGTQAMTLTVRAIANREITGANYKKVIIKEIFVCSINGVSMAIVGGIFSYIIFGSIYLSLVFSSSVCINFVTAGLLGSGIPILLHNLEIDPATSSGVFLTACTDSVGFFAFLGLSYCFLV